ncbi:MAG TPA: isoprenylcysteine carboxylmethyltransferase family protein [Thermomicrobiaceae bacterium]|nr:isoprenylcysteine carboxylmethyltransferase family protein [Thermomicrobiaceae bacterium]
MTAKPTAGASEANMHIIPPPVLYLGALLVGLLGQRLRPVRPLPRGLARPLGWLLIGAGLALGAWGVITFRGAGESPNPTQPTRSLVTSGPFRYSRNPLYLGMTAIYLGITALANSLWPLLLLPAVQRVMNEQIVPGEESYLARRFGAEYAEYRRRVRRWL